MNDEFSAGPDSAVVSTSFHATVLDSWNEVVTSAVVYGAVLRALFRVQAPVMRLIFVMSVLFFFKVVFFQSCFFFKGFLQDVSVV